MKPLLAMLLFVLLSGCVAMTRDIMRSDQIIANWQTEHLIWLHEQREQMMRNGELKPNYWRTNEGQ